MPVAKKITKPEWHQSREFKRRGKRRMDGRQSGTLRCWFDHYASMTPMKRAELRKSGKRNHYHGA